MGLCWGSDHRLGSDHRRRIQKPGYKNLPRAIFLSKHSPEQNAFSNENDRKDRLPQHGGAPICARKIDFATVELLL